MMAGDEEPLAECDRLANLQRRGLDRQRLLDHMGGHQFPPAGIDAVDQARVAARGLLSLR